jgi:hypothetical protein
MLCDVGNRVPRGAPHSSGGACLGGAQKLPRHARNAAARRKRRKPRHFTRNNVPETFTTFIPSLRRGEIHAACPKRGETNVFVRVANLWNVPCCRGEPLSDTVQHLKPDVILAADCVYFEPAFPLLLDTLERLLALNRSATIYFCFQKRRRADMQFLAKARKMFVVAEPLDEDRAVFSRQSRFLFTFSSKDRPQGRESAATTGAMRDV